MNAIIDPSRPKTQLSSGISGYLILYNFVSFIGWGYVLGQVLLELARTNGNYVTVHDKTGWILGIVQTGAILEVLHIIAGTCDKNVFK